MPCQRPLTQKCLMCKNVSAHTSRVFVWWLFLQFVPPSATNYIGCCNVSDRFGSKQLSVRQFDAFWERHPSRLCLQASAAAAHDKPAVPGGFGGSGVLAQQPGLVHELEAWLMLASQTLEATKVSQWRAGRRPSAFTDGVPHHSPLTKGQA